MIFPYIHISKNALNALIFCTASIFLTSCSDDPVALKPSQERYYGLQTGMWREYQVDSVVYRGSTSYANDTLQFSIREEIDSAYIDNTGARNYIVKTYARNSASEDWALRYITAASIASQRAELLYNNNRYVKLIFPAIEGQEWNANMYNDEDPDNFMKSKYIGVHQSASINGKSMDSTVTVQVQNYQDAITKAIETEQYAAGIGLVKHTWDEIETQPNKDKPGEVLNRGFQYTKTLTDHGKK